MNIIVGAGLIDFLVMDQDDPDTGQPLGAFGVYNDDDGKYGKFLRDAAVQMPNSIYVIKANNQINSELYSYCQTQMGSGKIHFLIDDTAAKNKLESQSQSKRMGPSKRADYLRPYVMTSVLKDQMLNLIEEHEGMYIKLTQNNRTIKKDKFSALIYALWWTKMDEEKRGKRKHGDISKMMFFSKH